MFNEETLCNSKKPYPSNVELKHSSNMENMPHVEKHEEKQYQDSFNDFIQSIESSALNIFIHSTSKNRKNTNRPSPNSNEEACFS